MHKAALFSLAAATTMLVAGWNGSVQAQQQVPDMTFFVTSTPIGKGADLGGLQGADAHCQELAAAVGAGNKIWRAYLSSTEPPNGKAVNARDPSATARGRIPRGSSLPRTSMIFTAPTTSSRARPH